MIQSVSYTAEVSGALPTGQRDFRVNEFVPCDWCSIFNTAAFFNLHKTEKSFYCQLCIGAPSQALGVAHFSEVEPGFFRSPRRGTFGGFEFNRPVRISMVEEFVDQVENLLKANGAKKIEIIEAPAVFAPSISALVCNVLHRKGYVPATPDLDYFMTVDEKPIWDKLKPSRRQRINRCRREGMTVVKLESSAFREAYDVIVENRKAKGFPVTMSYEAIQSMIGVFPDRLTFFGVMKDNALIASSICVNVSASVLYVFYWGDLPGYENCSPVSLLAEYIYDYARGKGFSLIDFGTSTKDGIPIYGLINFKREIGCFPSLKPSYVKVF